MKKILFILSLLIAGNGIAQKHKDTLIALPAKDGKVFYEKIFLDSGLNKNDLFINAKNVFIRLFPATKDVIQNEDRENGIIVGKGYFDFPMKGGILNITSGVVIKATISITVRDNKYKAEIFDFYEPGRSDAPIEKYYLIAKEKNKPSWFPYYSNFNTRVLLLFDQINDEMNKKLSTDF